MTDQPKHDRRKVDRCDECNQWRPLNPIYASHTADVTMRLCDECKAKRQAALEALWSGDIEGDDDDEPASWDDRYLFGPYSEFSEDTR